MAQLGSALVLVLVILLAVLIFVLTRKRQPASRTSGLASFFVGLSVLPALMVFVIWHDVLVGFLTGGFVYLSRFYDWVVLFPLLLSPFVSLISVGVLLIERKRRHTAGLAAVPLGIGLVFSIVGIAILFFFALLAAMIAEA